ncbi:MAG: glycosyltransferase family 4 protein [Candidatus Heimdallarchaeota archaeon]|nr:glycosyltransferase family 4 protein [Candidatus Heimdallarchaeota archaeon]
MKKILFAYKQCEFGGGAEKNMIEVAEHIGQNHQVSFIITGGYIDPRIQKLGEIFIFPSKGKALLFPLDLIYLVYLILTKKIDLIHAHHRYPAFLASFLRRLLKIKLITTVHNRFPDKGKISLWGDRAIAVSNGVAEWMLHDCGVNPELVTVIHNGISIPTEHSGDVLRAMKLELNLPSNVTLLCSVGRLTRQKNYPGLFRALAQIPASDWLLLLVGEGEDRCALEKQTTDLGLQNRIRFLGHRNDVDKIMQISQIFVMSSSWEGFPYVIIEALANGLPIVATDVGGVSEGVINNKTGYLVSSDNDNMLADKILALLSNPELRNQLSENGKKLFREQFLDKTMLNRIDAEYDKLLNNN